MLKIGVYLLMNVASCYRRVWQHCRLAFTSSSLRHFDAQCAILTSGYSEIVSCRVIVLA